ncbi:MAG: hypothetical protein COV47_02795 [Candidatus Diapherotrites archaeon CG11_big_fil_rev_8_21_14_0_20_37_9]|nr:MAG: hypothetical protein COV47_02795 [Candidatus Diapherotrites archaeon CG11_big_fil_rev_8_21_14_0_20_37_9]
MMKHNIPFSPLPQELMFKIGERFLSTGARISKLFPFLETELKQGEIGIEKEMYATIMAIMFAFYFIFGFLVTYIFATRFAPENALSLGLLIGAVFAFLVFFQVLLYPKIIVKKKVRNVERNLIFALRTLLVEIKSGVTLFDAITIVADGDNGQVSFEFKRAIEKIEAGMFQEESLEELAENNPSLFFRRAIWQLVNGLKAGSDISTVMEALVENLAKEKENQVRRYGNSLKLLSLLYMMLGAIIPALGLTFLIILSTFPQINIDEPVFWGMLGFILVGQFMYLGVIKSARPTLMGDE